MSPFRGVAPVLTGGSLEHASADSLLRVGVFFVRPEQPIDPLRQTLRDIHTELADLDKDAVELAAKIQGNFEELGV